jgi:MFS family permease
MPTRARYKVLGFLVMLAGITYLDRICISITAPHIMRDLGLSRVQMSWVFSVFTLAYGLFEIPTGHWGDKIGTRAVLTRIVIWWSSFTMITAGAFNYVALLVVRFLFGIGEAGAWPNVGRTLSRWFPLAERGTAQGIFFMGAHLGGALTPALVTLLLGFFHWRTLFLLFGLIGFVWAAAWYRWFRNEPSDHPAVNAEERALIEAGRGKEAAHHLDAARWWQLLTNTNVLALCGQYFTQSYGFAYYMYWLSPHLKAQPEFANPIIYAVAAGLPLYLSVPADLWGGITADRAVKRHGLRRGRALVGGGSLLAAGLFAIAGASAPNAYLSALLIGLAGGASAFLLGAAWATCHDVGGQNVGVVGAAMNTAGQVGAFLSPLVSGYIPSETTPLYIIGIVYLLGALCWRRIDPAERVWITPS